MIILALVMLFALGAPIFSVMLAAGAYGATTLSDKPFYQEFGNQIQDIFKIGAGSEALTLATIPLFIFMGFVMAEAKTADRLVRAARAGFGWMPGGLAVVTIFACALFTTFTGASGVTIVALGGLIMPSLLKEKYPKKFSLGIVAGTGSVGLLFPPALPLFVYGTVYGLVNGLQDNKAADAVQFSTDRFIFAGIVPGMLLLLVMSIFAMFIAKKHKVPRHKFDAKELGQALWIALPEILMPFLIIGSLANGVTIPEVASLACIYIMLVEVVLFKDVAPKQLMALVRDSMALVGAIFIIIFAASALTNFFVTAEVPRILFEWIRENFDNKLTFLLALNVFLILVGMTMDIFSAIVVVVPLIAPVAAAYGIDPYHLGIVFLLNLEIGYLTPPVGLNLFITSFAFKKPIDEVVKSVLPFLACMVITLILVTYIEAITVKPLNIIKPPDRRGRVGQMATEVKSAYALINSVGEVTLPDGKVIKLDDCKTMKDDAKTDCEDVFVGVSACREIAADKREECIATAISDYMEMITVGDDDDDDYPDEEDVEDGDEEYPDEEDDGDEEYPDEEDEDEDASGEEDEEYPDLEDEEEAAPAPAPAAEKPAVDEGEDEEYPDLEDEDG